MKELTTKQEELLGEEIIKLLNLKVKDGRVNTNEYGTKTALGLGRVILRLIDELPEEK